MVSSSKKLPCGHIFHTACLRSWFQRQQTCPTCRLNILRTPAVVIPQPQLNNNVNNNNNANARPVADQPAAPQINNPFLNLLSQNGLPNLQPGSSQSTSSASTTVPQMAPGTMPPFFFPSMPFMAPYTIPPPPMPQNIDQLTVEELRAMEGNERHHVEERIKLLKNIQTMINASMALMNQYQMVVANLPSLPLPVARSPTTTTTNEELKTKSDEPTSSTTSDEPLKSEVKLEDIGSEEFIDATPSTSSAPSTSKTDLDVSETLISHESSSSAIGTTETSEEANEIRKRRLQKFSPSD